VLTPVQFRVLRYCAFDGHWISLQEIDRALQPDDLVVVPSLVHRGLLAHRVTFGTVRVTDEGREVAGEP
jgi:hypothetical protein